MQKMIIIGASLANLSTTHHTALHFTIFQTINKKEATFKQRKKVPFGIRISFFFGLYQEKYD